MKFLICMPTGKDGIQDDAVIRDALLTAVNRITLMDEKSASLRLATAPRIWLRSKAPNESRRKTKWHNVRESRLIAGTQN